MDRNKSIEIEIYIDALIYLLEACGQKEGVEWVRTNRKNKAKFRDALVGYGSISDTVLYPQKRSGIKGRKEAEERLLFLIQRLAMRLK